MVKSLLKLLFSITAFVWAVYPTEVGESDEDIQEYFDLVDSGSSFEDNIEDISNIPGFLNISVALK